MCVGGGGVREGGKLSDTKKHRDLVGHKSRL